MSNMATEVGVTKLAYVAVLTGVENPVFVTGTSHSVPTGEHQPFQVESIGTPNTTGENPGSNLTPTPAETAESLTRQQKTSKNISKREEVYRRARVEGTSKESSGLNGKGSWKKLEVDVSFKKKKDHQERLRHGGTIDGDRGRKRSNRKESKDENGKGSSSNAKKPERSIQQRHDSDGNSRRNGRQRAAREQTQPRCETTSETKRDNREKSQHTRKNRTRLSRHKNQLRKRHQKKRFRRPQIPELSPDILEALSADALRQVEYFFSNDELSRNVWLRRHMDIDGYIPAAIIFNFPSVVAYGFQYGDLLAVVSEKSEKLQVDNENETIRLRDGYKQWLCPNPEGGFGRPRWIKQPDNLLDQTNGCSDEIKLSPLAKPRNQQVSTNFVLEDKDVSKTEAKSSAVSNDESSKGSNDTRDTSSCSDSENDNNDED